MKLYSTKEECVGCGACAEVCGKKAIHLVSDQEGFWYPEIDQEKCVNCGACQKVCQIHNLKLPENNFEPVVYAVKNKMDDIRALSTSGGVFSVLADYVIQNKGAVYGAAYSSDFTVQHERAITDKQYSRFRGSKYAQSWMGSCYTQVKADLTEDKKVLFTGTPCQIAGLQTFLGDLSKNNNLVLCEIICHGIPSPLIWKEHIQLLEEERHSKIVAYKNRSKIAGWHGHNEHVFFDSGKSEYKSKLSQNHKDLFYAHLTIRPCCHSCKFTGFPRIADFTIADYWGIERCMPEFDDNKGISLMILNSDRAIKMFDTVKSQLDYRESNLEDAFYDNHKKPAKHNIHRDEFWDDYHQFGYRYVVSKYAGYNTVGKIKRQTKIIIKAITKKIGIYNFVHHFTKKKYQKEVYK